MQVPVLFEPVTARPVKSAGRDGEHDGAAAGDAARANSRMNAGTFGVVRPSVRRVTRTRQARVRVPVSIRTGHRVAVRTCRSAR